MANKEEDRLARIARMEAIYDDCRAAVDDLLDAAQRYQALSGKLAELERYYLGKDWMDDFDADRRGQIPGDMKRGILTEDAIYDLLTDQDRMMALLRIEKPARKGGDGHGD